MCARRRRSVVPLSTKCPSGSTPARKGSHHSRRSVGAGGPAASRHLRIKSRFMPIALPAASCPSRHVCAVQRRADDGVSAGVSTALPGGVRWFGRSLGRSLRALGKDLAVRRLIHLPVSPYLSSPSGSCTQLPTAWACLSPWPVRVVAVGVLLSDGAVQLLDGVLHLALLRHLLSDGGLFRLGAAGVCSARAAFDLRLPDAILVACAYVTLGDFRLLT